MTYYSISTVIIDICDASSPIPIDSNRFHSTCSLYIIFSNIDLDALGYFFLDTFIAQMFAQPGSLNYLLEFKLGRNDTCMTLFNNCSNIFHCITRSHRLKIDFEDVNLM